MMEDTDVVNAAADMLSVSVGEPMKQGGQKHVYTASLQDGTRAVLKVTLLTKPAADPASLDRMLLRAEREVALLRSIDSSHVVTVLGEMVRVTDGDQVVGAAWIEEFVDGQDLIDLQAAAPDPWPWEEVRPMMIEIASGLAELHRRRVVHRDLSAHNVRRRANGTWVVLDPGWGKHLAEASITGTYQPGTLGYLTPEHVPGASPDTASDIFGLGILMWSTLTGSLPIPASTPLEEYMRRLAREQIPSIRTVRTGLPDAAVRVVDRSLQRMAARRFLDADELLLEAGGE